MSDLSKKVARDPLDRAAVRLPKGYLISGRDMIIVMMGLVLVAVPWSLWFSPKVQLSQAMAFPSMHHPLGTDSLGRDLLVRLSMALRESVLPLWGAIFLGTGIGGGLSLGLISRQSQRGWGILRITCDSLCIAVAVLPAGVLAFVWGAYSQRIDGGGVILSLSLVATVRTYLMLRDLARRDQTLAYWQAHAAMGGSPWRALWCYGVSGAWLALILEALTFHSRIAVAVEASVSYLGFGVAEPRASLGNMLAAHFSESIKGHVWPLFPLAFGLWLAASFPAACLRVGRLGWHWWGRARMRLSHRHALEAESPSLAVPAYSETR